MMDEMKQFYEQREKTASDHLAMCERIRKKLELPMTTETLVLIDQILRYGEHSYGAVEPSKPSMLVRAPIRLLSEKPIHRTHPNHGKPTPIVGRPQTSAMRVEEIEILSNPDEWMIADVQVGHRSQLPTPGPPLPGRLFVLGGTCHRFVTETLQTAMDFTMLVHYVGSNPEGGIFEAVAMGSLA